MSGKLRTIGTGTTTTNVILTTEGGENMTTNDINTRLLFRFYNKTERRYLTDKEARKITYNSLSSRTDIATEQCSGFYDKWQIDLIYEGDVVEDESGRVGIVYFEQQTGQYLFGEYWKLAGEKLEIIGNCHSK